MVRSVSRWNMDAQARTTSNRRVATTAVSQSMIAATLVPEKNRLACW